MVYLHSFPLSNRMAITFPRHEKGDCVRPSVSTDCRVYLIAMNGCHLLKHLTEPLTCCNYLVITLSACAGVLGPRLRNATGPAPFSKDLFAMQSAYIPSIEWIWQLLSLFVWNLALPVKKWVNTLKKQNRRKWITVCTHLWCDYQTSLNWLKDWSYFITACLYLFECLVYILQFMTFTQSLADFAP